jgi:hypothetical protein
MTTGPEKITDHVEKPDRGADLDDVVQVAKQLISQGVLTAGYIEGLRKDIRRQTRTTWIAIAIGAIILIALGGVVVDNHNRVTALQHKMCPMVTILIPGPTDPQPPAGPEGDRGRDVIGRATTLAGAFGCH